MLYYIVVITGAATLAQWIMEVITWIDEGGARK